MKNEGFKIKTLYDLQNLLSRFEVNTKEQYDSWDEQSLMVVDIFDVNYVDDMQRTTKCIGFVFSTKSLIQKIPALRSCQEDGFSLEIDGTFNLVRGGWVLMILATHVVTRESKKTGNRYNGQERFYHSSRPFLFMLTRTECHAATCKLLQAYKKICADFLLVPYVPASVCMDHSDPIRSATTTEFPEVEGNILDCWAHVKRKMGEQKQRSLVIGSSAEKDAFLGIAKDDADILHISRSESMFSLLSTLMIEKWVLENQRPYADWFKKVYLQPKWLRWFCTASGIPGVLPNNNALEALNRVVKAEHVIGKTMTLQQFFKDGCPSLMKRCEDLYSEYGGELQRQVVNQAEEILCNPRQIPSEMFEKAVQYASTPSSFMRGTGEMFKDSYFVNAKQQLGLPVTATRVELFCGAKYIHEHPNENAQEAPNSALSFFTTVADRIRDSEDSSTFVPGSFAQAVFMCNTLHEVKKLSEYHYSCDCKQYYHTAFLCSHILLVYHLEGQFNVLDVYKSLTVSKKRGRPARSNFPTTLSTTPTYTISPGDSVFFPIHQTGVAINFNASTNMWMVFFENSTSGSECQFCSCSRTKPGNIHLLLRHNDVKDGKQAMVQRINNWESIREPEPSPSPQKSPCK